MVTGLTREQDVETGWAAWITKYFDGSYSVQTSDELVTQTPTGESRLLPDCELLVGQERAQTSKPRIHVVITRDPYYSGFRDGSEQRRQADRWEMQVMVRVPSQGADKERDNRWLARWISSSFCRLVERHQPPKLELLVKGMFHLKASGPQEVPANGSFVRQFAIRFLTHTE